MSPSVNVNSYPLTGTLVLEACIGAEVEDHIQTGVWIHVCFLCLWKRNDVIKFVNEIGRAHVWTTVTFGNIVFRFVLYNNNLY